MTQLARTALKGYFETGDIPTQSNFGDLIDSFPLISEVSQGTNYILVKGQGTPTENAVELQAAYDTAKTMPRYLGELDSTSDIEIIAYKGQTFYNVDGTGSYGVFNQGINGILSHFNFGLISNTILEQQAKSTRATIIVAPGTYNFLDQFSQEFTLDASGIDIVSLTGNADVLLDGITVSADYCYIKGINCGDSHFTVGDNLANLICENCNGGNFSFGYNNIVSGTFINCIGGDFSFCGCNPPEGGDGIASGKFINCVAGNLSFCPLGLCSGTFTNCVGGLESFGCGGTASGTFKDCVGGDGSFGNGGSASGTFKDCVGGDGSFGGGDGGSASGTFTNCIGSEGSFGGGDGTATGKFIDCVGDDNSFGGSIQNGYFLRCVGGGSSFGYQGNNNGSFYYCIGTDDNNGLSNGLVHLYCISNDSLVEN